MIMNCTNNKKAITTATTTTDIVGKSTTKDLKQTKGRQMIFRHVIAAGETD